MIRYLEVVQVKDYITKLEVTNTKLAQKSILQPKKKKLVIRMWSWICDTMNQKGEA